MPWSRRCASCARAARRGAAAAMTKKRRRLAAAVEALCTRRRWLWLIPLLSTTTVLALWAVRSAQDAADDGGGQGTQAVAHQVVGCQILRNGQRR